MAIKFKRLTRKQFTNRYTEALDDGEDIIVQNTNLGEVCIPGHGWVACTLGPRSGMPYMFWTDDDGWETVPKVKFVEVK